VIQQLDGSITRTKSNELEVEYTVHKLPLAPKVGLSQIKWTPEVGGPRGSTTVRTVREFELGCTGQHIKNTSSDPLVTCMTTSQCSFLIIDYVAHGPSHIRYDTASGQSFGNT